MGEAGDIEFAGVFRGAGDLGTAVDAGGGGADISRHGASPDFLVGLRLRRAARRLRQRADDGAARQVDLESVVLEALGVAQQEVGRARERRAFGGLPAQRRFGRRIAPRLVRDAAERQPRLLDRVAVELQRGRDRTSANA